MDNLMVDVFKHFQLKMVPNILLLQAQENPYHGISGNQDHSPENTVQTLDELGEELVQRCEGLDVYQVSMKILSITRRIMYATITQVWTFLRTDVYYKKQSVLSLRPELVPNIRPSTVQYVYSLLSDSNIAIRDKKEFLSESDFDNYRQNKIKKVTHGY